MQTAKPPGVVAFGNSQPWIEFENTQGRVVGFETGWGSWCSARDGRPTVAFSRALARD